MSGTIRIVRLAALVVWMTVMASLVMAAEETAAKAKRPAAAPKSPESTPTLALSDERVQEIAKATGLTSDVVRVSLEYITKYKPRMARDLETTLKVDPPQYRSHLSNQAYYARELAQLKRSDPARGAQREQTLELEAQAERLCDRYKEVSEAERPKVEIELLNALSKVFDLRLEEERYQLDQLKKQVEQMQTRITERVRNKDRIVDRQLTTLLGISELLTW